LWWTRVLEAAWPSPSLVLRLKVYFRRRLVKERHSFWRGILKRRQGLIGAGDKTVILAAAICLLLHVGDEGSILKYKLSTQSSSGASLLLPSSSLGSKTSFRRASIRADWAYNLKRFKLL
jgi:hypothetical protein